MTHSTASISNCEQKGRSAFSDGPIVSGLFEVEAVEVHYFGPGVDKVLSEFVFGLIKGVDLGDSSEFGVGTEDEIDGGGGPLEFTGFAVVTFIETVCTGLLPFGGHVEQVDEEVIAQDAWLVGEDAVFGLIGVGV